MWLFYRVFHYKPSSAKGVPPWRQNLTGSPQRSPSPPRLEVSGDEARVEGEAFELWHEGEVGHVALEWRKKSVINEVFLWLMRDHIEKWISVGQTAVKQWNCGEKLKRMKEKSASMPPKIWIYAIVYCLLLFIIMFHVSSFHDPSWLDSLFL